MLVGAQDVSRFGPCAHTGEEGNAQRGIGREEQDAVAAAAKAQDQASLQLDTARAAHQEASRQKSKFVDLARNYAEAQVRELERKEDLEMEEAASVARDREDWEAHDPEAVA